MPNNITIQNLSIGYSQSKKETYIQKDLNFSFSKGEFIAITGNNGSGKSTLLKTMAGLIKPLKGKVQIGEESVENLSAFQRFENIAYMPTERPNAPFLTCQDIIETSLRYLYKKENTQSKLTELTRYFNAENLVPKMFATLSDGQKQKILLITILARNTPIVLLDEALVYLDYETKIKTMEYLKKICLEENKMVVLISHELDLLKKYVAKNYELKIII